MSKRALIRRGFTLIELLTVIAISVILMGLIMIPLYKSFELARTAQSLVDAQDGARRGISQVARDMNEAMFVFDDRGSVILPVRALDGTLTLVQLGNARVDMVLPEMIVHCNNPAHGVQPRDYSRRDARFSTLALALPPCPVCGSHDVEIRPKLPMKQDVTIVRYFLGLRNNDPTIGWKSWDPANKAPGDANPVVMYRVEFDPNNPNFANYKDTGFFYDENNAPDGVPFWRHWAEMVAPVSSTRYQDLVTAVYLKSGPDAGTPAAGSMLPTIQFRFAGVDNVQFVGNNSDALRQAVGIPAPSTAFRAPDGYWSNLTSVSVYTADASAAYTATADSTGRVLIQKYTRAGGAWAPAGGPQFDVSDYVTTGNILSAGGRDAEMAFYYNRNEGLVNFALKPMPPSPYPIAYPYADPTVDPILSIERVSPIHPDLINNDPDRRARLATFDPASSNFLANADVVMSSVKVFVAEPSGASPLGYRWVRYHLAPEGGFKTGPQEFWVESGGWLRFGDNVPVVMVTGGLVLPVLVDYDVQYNRAGDVVVGSYVTKSRMQVSVGMKVYDAISRKPSLFGLTEIVTVGNALR